MCSAALYASMEDDKERVVEKNLRRLMPPQHPKREKEMPKSTARILQSLWDRGLRCLMLAPCCTMQVPKNFQVYFTFFQSLQNATNRARRAELPVSLAPPPGPGHAPLTQVPVTFVVVSLLFKPTGWRRSIGMLMSRLRYLLATTGPAIRATKTTKMTK